jgi:hypothetical protein
MALHPLRRRGHPRALPTALVGGGPAHRGGRPVGLVGCGEGAVNKPDDLASRAKAYAATAAAYAADPLQVMFLEVVRRDVEAAHKWLAAQVKK